MLVIKMKTKEQIEAKLKEFKDSYFDFIRGKYPNMSDQELREIALKKLQTIETLEWVLK